MTHDKLIKFIEESVSIDSSETELIKKYFKPFAANKKEILEKENRIANHLYFINAGFVRVFHIEEGVEISTHINCHPGFITSFHSFISAAPASDNVESITQCELLKIAKKDYDALYQRSKMWVAFCKNIYEKAIVFNEQRTKDILTLSAEKRYLKLISTQPEIIQNIPLQYIASYIGVKPESLSRIRRQIIS